MPKQFRNEKWRQFIAMGYSCLVHQTLSYSLLCSIVEIFWRGSFVPLACRARGHLPHSAPVIYATAATVIFVSVFV